MINPSLIERAQAWLAQDPDPETSAELASLIAKADLASLSELFDSRIGFGTAGLRGALGPGPNRMNRVLVSQAACGIARYLKTLSKHPSVVIGYDARKNSQQFAQDSAEIFAGFGIKTFLFDSLAATPLLAFAALELGTTSAIMVTASHNPRGDNGYKVYDESGSQIISPTDSEIAALIAEVASSSTLGEFPRSTDYYPVAQEIREKYIAATAELVSNSAEFKLKVVYSAMHGVGASYLEEIFEKAGWPKPIHVTRQQQPDGSFPTLPFPNPEEPGASDLALETARANHADLVLINDPDADRLAVIYRSNRGDYLALSGDELGLILAEELAKRSSGRNGNLACSIVSSSILGHVAKHYGLGFTQTLTGFKWIARVPNLIFGYEEALGYCVMWEKVRDKDGLSAAVVISDIANALLAEGKTLGDQLDQLRQRYGYHLTSQISIRVSDISQISATMQKIRNMESTSFTEKAARLTDLARSTKLPATDALRIDFENKSRIIIRPSGTEPKLKCYLEVVARDYPQAEQMLSQLRSYAEELIG